MNLDSAMSLLVTVKDGDPSEVITVLGLVVFIVVVLAPLFVYFLGEALGINAHIRRRRFEQRREAAVILRH